MNPQKQTNGAQRERVAQALAYGDASVRLKAALAAGSDPDPALARRLVERCGVEPDFFVRDMLTWALTRHPVEAVLPLLLEELHSAVPQAVAQSLHSLSKIGDARAYPQIIDAHLTSSDDEVARTAWRTAAGLAPFGDRPDLAGRLAAQLGRGDREMRRSLSRAFLQLGEAAEPVLRRHGGTHARATLLLLADPDLGFDAAEHEAGHEAARKPGATG